MINNEKMLTTRQKQILEYIRTCVHKFGYPPSVREICKEVGLSSTSTVHGYLHRLEDLGYIRRDPAKNRTIELLDEGSWRSKKIVPLPLVGQVRAGAPIFAEECVEDVYPFPADFIGNDDCFMLVVQGDSMKNAGILEGDQLIVRRQETAETAKSSSPSLAKKRRSSATSTKPTRSACSRKMTNTNRFIPGIAKS